MDKIQWIEHKIMDSTALLRYCRSQQVSGKKIVFTNGCFDILHHGHLDLLAKAANEGDLLVLGLNSDASVQRLKGAERPINNQSDRAFQLASLLCVDAVCLFEEDTPLSLIQLIQPDVLVKGGDYALDQIVGAAEVIAKGGKVSIIPFVAGYSTTGLIGRIRSL